MVGIRLSKPRVRGPIDLIGLSSVLPFLPLHLCLLSKNPTYRFLSFSVSVHIPFFRLVFFHEARGRRKSRRETGPRGSISGITDSSWTRIYIIGRQSAPLSPFIGHKRVSSEWRHKTEGWCVFGSSKSFFRLPKNLVSIIKSCMLRDSRRNGYRKFIICCWHYLQIASNKNHHFLHIYLLSE